MHRLAELEHDVIGDIHHWADRALPCAAQPLAHPQWCHGAIVDAANDAAGKRRAGRRVFDPDRQLVARRRREAADHRARELRAGEGGHLARDSENRHRVTAVRRDVEIEHRLVEVEVRAQRLTERGIRRQLENPARPFRDPEFLRGSEHALRFDATQLRRLDRDISRECRPYLGEGALESDAGVARATDDLHRLAAAGGHLAHRQLLGLGVARDGHDLRHDNSAEGRRCARERLELEARHGEALAELGRRPGQTRPFGEPGVRDFHALNVRNCRRNRKSFSKNSRRSLTP